MSFRTQRSHTRTVLSKLADAILGPFGLNCAEVTAPLCPTNVCTHSPVAALHTRTVLVVRGLGRPKIQSQRGCIWMPGQLQQPD
jgi:hypothetical protein